MTLELPFVKNPQPVSGRLAGQRLLITGAAGSLGGALAEMIAAEGGELVLLDSDLKGLEALHDRIEAAGHGQPGLYPLDLMGASPDDYTELAERIRSALGGLDVVVQAEAALGEPAPIGLYAPQQWLETLHVNLNGAFMMTQACLPLLRESAGAMLFISDACGRSGQAAMGAYAVSKWGLEGLMQTLAAESSEAHPVTACSIDPGPLRSGLRRRAYAGEMPEEAPIPEGAAAAILSLLGTEGSPKNGGQYKVTT